MRNEAEPTRQAGRCSSSPPVARHLFTVGTACCLLVVASLAAAQRPREVRRAKPPAGWDKAATGTFYDDAFSILVGPRPVFATPAGVVRPPDAGVVGPTEGTAFKWSAIVSDATLVDEIKQARAATKAAVAKVSDFKGGGYKRVRVAFGAAAAAFGVIAAYDKDVRWKNEATAARDLIARAGLNCKVGTDQSFNEAKDRVGDLDALLEGSSLTAAPDREDDFLWSQVAERSTLMMRLEAAEGLAAASASSRSDFVRQVERIVHEAEITAMVAEVLQQRNFDDHDDAAYREHAAAMQEAALRLRDAALKRDHEAGLEATGLLKKSCDSCHADYR